MTHTVDGRHEFRRNLLAVGTCCGVPTKPLGTHPLRNAAFDLTRTPAERLAMWKPVEDSFEEPLVGVTTDGHPIDGLRPLRDDGFDPTRTVLAVDDVLALLTDEERRETIFPVDANEWRPWTGTSSGSTTTGSTEPPSPWRPGSCSSTRCGRATRSSRQSPLGAGSD
jgi:hypothetical protein